MTRHFFLRTALVLALALTACHAQAQLAVGINTNRHRYIAYEPIKVGLTIRNDSGNSLVFDGDELLHFVIIDNKGELAMPLRNVGQVLDGLEMRSGSVHTVEFALNTYFAMQNESDYEIYAQVGHPRLTSDFRSNRIIIEVRRGSVVWERSFGLPARTENDDIDMRQAKLLRYQEKETDVYCLRIEDQDSVYSVSRIADRIIGANPECEVDAMGNIHIFLRIRARLFIYQVYTHEGELKQEKLYAIEETRPGLYHDPDLGKVTVIGGRPAIRGSDYVLPGDETPTFEGVTPVLEPL